MPITPYVFALQVGDIVITGTPSGVGCFRKPPIFLKHGDECIVEIDGIGRLTNMVKSVRRGPPDEIPSGKRARL